LYQQRMNWKGQCSHCSASSVLCVSTKNELKVSYLSIFLIIRISLVSTKNELKENLVGRQHVRRRYRINKEWIESLYYVWESVFFLILYQQRMNWKRGYYIHVSRIWVEKDSNVSTKNELKEVVIFFVPIYAYKLYQQRMNWKHLRSALTCTAMTWKYQQRMNWKNFLHSAIFCVTSRVSTKNELKV